MCDEGQKSASAIPPLHAPVDVFPQSISKVSREKGEFPVSAGLCHPPKTCLKAVWLDVSCHTLWFQSQSSPLWFTRQLESVKPCGAVNRQSGGG